MTELNSLGQTIITMSPDDVKLDGYIKKVLAFKPILARIFKETVVECKDMSYEEIAKCIEGDVDISIVGVNPGYTNLQIEGQSQEDMVNGEGKVTFDIRTKLLLANSNSTDSIGIKILVDVEAQKDDTPGYDISERAIFYCSRMLSAQLSTEFTNNSADRVKYGNLKKVYSIWICTESAQIRANTIERYRIQRTVKPEEKNTPIPRYDLLEAIIVNISKKHDTEGVDSVLIQCLTDLLNENISADQKIKKLQQQYQIPTTIEFEEEVHDMTAYAARLIRESITKGLTEGRAVGIAEGRAEERAYTIKTLLVNNCPEELFLSLGYTEDEIAKVKESLDN